MVVRAKCLIAVLIVCLAASILNLCLGIKSNPFGIASLLYIPLCVNSSKVNKVDFLFIVSLFIGVIIQLITTFSNINVTLNNGYSVFVLGFLCFLLFKRRDSIK